MVDALVGERLSAQPLGVGDERGVARLAALGERDRTGDDREHEQRGDAGQQRAQAAVGAPAPLGLGLRGGARGREELALERVEILVVGGRPL